MEKDIDKNYLAQIQRYPLLTPEEEAELSKKIEEGDSVAFNKLVNSNLRLVVSIAHKFNNTRLSMMDLIQEGNLGLMTAAEKFHYSFNTRFSTYAYPWIVQYMLRYANTRVSFITLPHRKNDLIRKIQVAQSAVFQETGHEASVQEIAEYIGISEEKVNDLMTYSYSVASLDSDTSDEDNSLTVGDFLSDVTYSPENMYLKEEEKTEIRSMMENLPGNEKKVLWYRYNFDYENHTKTLREISKIIGVSPEAVRQTEIRAIKHMKSAASVNGKEQDSATASA